MGRCRIFPDQIAVAFTVEPPSHDGCFAQPLRLAVNGPSLRSEVFESPLVYCVFVAGSQHGGPVKPVRCRDPDQTANGAEH